MSKSEIILESRITKLESQSENISEDIKEIKRTLFWLTGLIFGLNTTIIGILTKGFGAL